MKLLNYGTCALALTLTIGNLSAQPESAAVETVNEITQYGITWKMAAPARAGRFVTGDWWVIGPLEIESVSPAADEIGNGSVVNPAAGSRQGYDSRLAGFDAGLRASFPLKMEPGDSLVTVASVANKREGASRPDGEKTADAVPGGAGVLRTAVVLTCLGEVPPADAFRPAYVGKWREIFRSSKLRRDLLPRLEPGEAKPNLAQSERFFERIWLDHMREWVNRAMHPFENMPGYGRELTHVVSNAALALLLDDSVGDKEKLLLRFVQIGIDYYGTTLSDNDLWIANGGHNSGRKWPIVFAGLMLDRDDMMRVKASFAEDQQTYYGPGFKGQKALWTIRRAVTKNSKHEEVDPATWETFGDGSNNGTKAESYRRLNGPTWVGEALAARILGTLETWDHPAFFDYVDRWVAEQSPDFAPALPKSMWEKYREQADEMGTATRRKSLEGRQN